MAKKQPAGLPEPPPERSARDFLPKKKTLASLERAAAFCRGCDLFANAKQTVFGRGPKSARVVLVGEQPGNDEDLAGEPFVGPAGRLLDEALQAAGISRADAYVTNVVKHFKWRDDTAFAEQGGRESRHSARARTHFAARKHRDAGAPRGKRRIHSKPSAHEIAACGPWLGAELAQLEPVVLVCLGATAAQALLGRGFKLLASRGEVLATPLAEHAVATVHPSSVLRQPDSDSRAQARRELIKDLKVVARLLG